MAMRVFFGFLAVLTIATSASAQFYSFGPRSIGPYPPGFSPVLPLPSGGVSIRSPFFRMDVSPYGGRHSTPYSSFSVPGPGSLVPPRSSFYPRGFRDPSVNPFGLGGIDTVLPRQSFPESDSPGNRPIPPRYATPAPDFESSPSELDSPPSSIVEPDPVPPPRYEIPSFSDVFPDESADPAGASVRIANRLQRAVDRLSAAIGSRESADVWSNYLRLDELQNYSHTLADVATVTPEMLETAESLLVNFDAVVATPDLGWLSSSSGFADIRSTLRDIVQYASPSAPSSSGQPGQARPQRSESPAAERQIEDLPAPPAKPIRKPKRVFRAEL